MPYQVNELGQPIGCAIENFNILPLPNFTKLTGLVVSVEPISDSHLPTLYSVFARDMNGKNWTYLPYGPFANEGEFVHWAEKTCFGEDPKFYTIAGPTGPAGLASYLRIKPNIGCIEIGHIHLSPLLQQTRAGTEALLLMIEWVFESGYRRLEWKCDSLNEPSRRAAKRLGFSYEGTFRQAMIYKSRNRDTSWYAITSEDWPALKDVYQTWRACDNFRANNIEIKKLSELTAQAMLK
jgi:RimJ/RimL family protein N-acetyltransferase